MAAHKQQPLSNMNVWKRWKEQRDEAARNELIEQYVPLVQFVSGKMAIGLPRTVSKNELESLGVLGLIDAIDKFDHERGLQFETYASWRIRGAIIDGLRQDDWVPRSVREKAKKIEEAYQVLEQKYMRTVTDEEMCHYLNLAEGEFQQIIQEISVTTVVSLEDPIKDEESETRMSLLVDDRLKKPDEKVNDWFLKDALTEAIGRLTEKERTVISLFYYEDLSLSEIAEVMSLSPSRISQLHSKAVLRLRGSLNRSKHLLLAD